jgi:hypothetical protein
VSDDAAFVGANRDLRPEIVGGGAGDRSLRIVSSVLSFIKVDHQTRLQFGETEVVIESPFVLEVAGHKYYLDSSEGANLGPVLALYPGSLLTAAVDDLGTLSLHFSDGATVSVQQDPQYEAWQVNGPGNYLVVCTPGTTGELAIWA